MLYTLMKNLHPQIQIIKASPELVFWNLNANSGKVKPVAFLSGVMSSILIVKELVPPSLGSILYDNLPASHFIMHLVSSSY